MTFGPEPGSGLFASAIVTASADETARSAGSVERSGIERGRHRRDAIRITSFKDLNGRAPVPATDWPRLGHHGKNISGRPEDDSKRQGMTRDDRLAEVR